VKSVLEDPEKRAEAGRRGRAYAEQTFDIARIGDRFEAVLSTVCSPKVPELSSALAVT
jgi:hypothetical protein